MVTSVLYLFKNFECGCIPSKWALFRLYVCDILCSMNITRLTDGSTRESDTIVVGGVRNVQIRLEVRNNGEDAFQAAVAITIPPELEFGRVVGRFSNNVSCVGSRLYR